MGGGEYLKRTEMSEWKGEGCRDRAVADSGGLRENCYELSRVARICLLYTSDAADDPSKV